MFEVSTRVKNGKSAILKSACLRYKRFFSGYNKKLRKENSSELVRIITEKQVSEARKKIEKLTFEISIWVKKNYFF